MLQWAAVEHQIRQSYPTPQRARLKTLALTGTVLLLAMAEHGLSISTHSKSNSLTEWVKNYSLSSHPFIFSSLEYSFALGVAVQILSRIATVTWNFTDLFLMIIGQSLTLRFDQFNNSILKHTLTRHQWSGARTQFASLAHLTRSVDAQISGIIFLSFANNLYFICMQLLNGLTPYEGADRMMHSVYYWASFTFLLSRTAAVTIYLSNVHVASKNGLPAVYACPSGTFTQDTERLLNQMSSDELSLTGLGLFHVTRSFLLAVAGAIATYEVVLIQFNVAIIQTNPGNATKMN
ncbi:gustatory receptor for sugar taste 64f-like [Cloeon dipterum]|uniref:gustatory receptor for sugar taste 64f-like n=1 Tax=Cloeon dipterum TaxID=197152 RepID=UPI00321FC061